MKRVTLVLVVPLLLAAAGCGSDDKPSTSARATPAPGSGCKQVATPQARPAPHLKAPTKPLAANRKYFIDVKTSCGALTIQVDQEASPHAAASFVALAKRGYFDKTAFFRAVPDYIVQGGDPLGNGSGDPGYTTRDTPPAGATYTKGIVAMAKAGDEPPGTAGSQFFIVTGDASTLTPEYAVLGGVVKGFRVAQGIDRLGDINTERPRIPVVLEEAKVRVG